MSAIQQTATTLGDFFPPSFGYAHLSILLGRSVSSLQTDRCRRPWLLPPACTMQGSKQPIWLLSDVLAWLAQHREPQASRPAAPARRGRPTKATQIARQRAAAARQGGAA